MKDNVEFFKSGSDSIGFQDDTSYLRSCVDRMKDEISKYEGINETISSISKINSNLSQEIVKIGNENDLLKNQDKISQKVIQELKKEINENKESFKKKFTNIEDEYNQKIGEMARSIRELMSQLDLQEKSNKKLEELNNSYEDQISNIAVLASQYFKKPMSTVSELVDFFVGNQHYLNGESPISEALSEIEFWKSKYLKMKNNLKKTKKELSFQITNIQECHNQELGESQAVISSLRNEMLNLSNESEKAKNIAENQHNDSLVRISQLKDERNDQETRFLEIGAQYASQIEGLTVKLQNEINEKSSLKRQANSLISQIKSMKLEFDHLKQQLSQIEVQMKGQQLENETLIEQMKSINYEKGVIQTQMKDFESQCLNARNQIVKYEIRIRELSSANHEQKEVLNNLMRDNEKKENTIQELQRSLNEIATSSKQKEYDLSNYKSQYFKMEETKNRLEEEVRSFKNKVFSGSSAEISHSVSLSIQKLPLEVIENINKVINTGSSPAGTQIRSVIGIIIDYFESTIKIHKLKYDSIQKDLENTNRIHCIYVEFFESIFSDISIDHNCIANDEKERNQIRKSIEDKIRQNYESNDLISKYENLINSIMASIQVTEINEITPQISFLYDYFNSNNQGVSMLEGKLKEIEKSFKRILKENRRLIRNISYLQSENEECTKTINHIQRENDNLSATNEHFTEEKRNHDLIRGENFDLARDSRVKEISDQLIEEKSKSKTLEKDLNQIKKLNEETNLKNQVLRKSLLKKENDLNELKKQMEENCQNTVDKINDQKDITISQYERQIDLLGIQIEEKDEKLGKQTDLIKSYESNILDSQENIDKLRKTLERVEKMNNNLKEEIDRDRIVYEQNLKTFKLTTEREFNKKVEEIKMAFKETKRAIYSLISSHFAPLVYERIDDSNFESTITNIATSLRKLINTDNRLRKILSLSPEDSIEEKILDLEKNHL